MLEPTEPAWRKSSHSAANGCVEFLELHEHVAVRDSKDRAGPVLRFSKTTWEEFIGGVRDGEFDLPGR